MRKADGFYLYQVGAALQQIRDIKYSWDDQDTGGINYQEAFYTLKGIKDSLDKFLKSEIYQPKICIQKGEELSDNIQKLIKRISNDSDKNKLILFGDMYPINHGLSSFEAVLSSEFALMDMYVITKKGGYDISELMVNGHVCFPKALGNKVPESLPDIRAGTKCIAVSLPTAAGFHLHRANEAVLRRYWDAVTNGAEHPNYKNMGEYLRLLDEKDAGDKNVRSALRDLKNLHRNPLAHPDHTIEDIEEAIALMDHIKTVIFHMLKAIPETLLPVPSANNFSDLLVGLTSPDGVLTKEAANSDEVSPKRPSLKV